MAVSQKDTNRLVREIIDNKRLNNPDLASYSNYELELLKNYTGCIDSHVPEQLNKDIWEYLYSEIKNLNPLFYGALLNSVDTQILVTNAGSGKLIMHSPDYAIIHTYGLDSYCYEIIKALMRHRIKSGNMTVELGDISEYFTQEAEPTMGYDVVIVQPEPNTNYHKMVDGNRIYSNMTPEMYYPLRASWFVKKGGFLVLVTSHPSVKEVLKGNHQQYMKGKFEPVKNIESKDNFYSLILKRIK